MASLNKAMIIGNLGRDPEIRYTQDGKAVANFSLATTDKWKDKVTGENREKTEWHRVVAFGRLGEICGEYLSKGKQVYIEGRLRTRSWEKDGITRYTTEIEATVMQMLGAKGTSGGGGGYQNNNMGTGGGFQQQNQGNFNNGNSPQNNSSYENPGHYGQPPQPPDDDIPF